MRLKPNLPYDAFFIAVLLMALPALGNFVGNDTSNFNPVPSGIDFITVQSSETLGPGIINTGFFANESKNTLPKSIDVLGNEIKNESTVIFSDMSIAYGLMDRLEFGTSFSYLLNQDVKKVESGAQFAGTGLNEIRLLSKYNFLKRDPVGAALVFSMNFNQSDNNPFSGVDAGPTKNIEGVLDYKWGHSAIALNLGYRFRQKGEMIKNSVYEPLGNQLIASLGTSLYVPSVDTKFIMELFAAKPSESSTHVKASQISSEILAGLKYDANAYTALHLGAGTRTGEGLFTPDWRIYVGANITFDLLNRSSVSAPVILPPPIQVTQHYKGYLSEDIEKLKTTSFDEVAKTHEFQLKTGVPEKDFAGVKPPLEIIRLDNFDFDFGSSKIRPEYHDQLNNLANYLAAEPEVLKVRVEGHTDSLGSLERNRIRSKERAESVKAFLVKTGKVPKIEMEAAGFGADRPIADNGNFQGRKQNRRVEVRILRKLTQAPERIKEEKPK